MKRIMQKTISCVLAACMALSLNPAAALAEPDDASVGEMGAFSVDADGQTAAGSTDVTVLHIADYGVFGIVDQIHHGDLSTKGGLWVQVGFGEQPYQVAWYRQKAAVAADGGVAAAPAFDEAWVPVGTSSRDRDDQTLFTWDAAADRPAADGDTYYYWAVATDAAGAVSKPSAPITFAYETGYIAGAIYDDVLGKDWTWSMGGEFTYGGQTYGGDGSVRKNAQLSAPQLSASGAAYGALERAAAEGSDPARIEGAWQVAVSAADYDDTYAGNVLVRIDVSETVKALAGDGADAGALKDALDSLGLLWLAPDGATIKPVAKGGASGPSTDEPYGLAAAQEGGACYLVFYMPEELAGESGMLGAFAVTSPVARGDALTAEVSATEGGQISGAGTRMLIRGTSPEFILYPQVNAGYCIKGVEVVYISKDGSEAHEMVQPTADGEQSASSAGTLVGNTFTMAPIGSTAAEGNIASYKVIAHFAKVEQPGPDDPAGKERTVSVSVDRTGADSDDTQVTFYAGLDELAKLAGGQSKAGLKVAASQGLTVSFDAVAAGYAPDKVIVSFTGGEKAGKSVTYAVPEGADSISMDALAGDASIRVTFAESIPPIVVGQPHALSVAYADGQDASMGKLGVEPASVDDNGTATFWAEPATGYRVVSALVSYKVGDGGEWRTGAVYGADQLTGGTSLTLTNILYDTRVAFTFDVRSITLKVQQDVEHATVAVSGAQALGDGAYAVAFGTAGASVRLAVEDGYQLAAGGMVLRPAQEGASPVTVGASSPEKGVWVTANPLDYSFLADNAGDGATLTFAIEKAPIVLDPDDPDDPDSSVEVGPDDVDRVISVKPTGDDKVIGEVVVDGHEVLDEDGVELKDKLTERDEGGLWWHPDYPGIKYDPKTDEYVLLPSGDRFKYDPVEGTIIFTRIDEGNAHTVSITTAPGAQVHVRVQVDVSADGESAGTGSGSIIPVGRMKWKADQPMMLIAIPDEGSSVQALYVNNEKVALGDAGAEHVSKAKLAQAKACVWTNKSDLESDDAEGGAAQMSKVARVWARPMDAVLVAAANVSKTVDVAVPEGTKYYEIPASVFGGRASADAGTQPIPVYAVFRKDASGPQGSQQGKWTISASVRSGQGIIEGAAEQVVSEGQDCTVTFKPAMGYRVSAVHVDGGPRQAWTARSYTFRDVHADHTIEVEFTAIGYAGDNGTIARAVRTLQTLAVTGDLNAPALTLLIGVAFAAAGVAVLTRSRRREGAHAEE